MSSMFINRHYETVDGVHYIHISTKDIALYRRIRNYAESEIRDYEDCIPILEFKFRKSEDESEDE